MINILHVGTSIFLQVDKKKYEVYFNHRNGDTGYHTRIYELAAGNTRIDLIGKIRVSAKPSKTRAAQVLRDALRDARTNGK